MWRREKVLTMSSVPQKAAADNGLLQAALWYAGRGIPVFPLQPREKGPPKGTHGFKDATTNEGVIRAWWEKWPDANIGIPMGQRSGLLLLDLDFRNKTVVESRDDLVEQFGEVPETAEVVSGSGGRHIYFKFPGIKVPKQIANGVELKGEGGYAVVPPSTHPNGTEYTFDGITGRNAILKVADPPAWLLNAIIETLKPRGGKTTTTDAEKFPEGSRNNSLTSLAGKLRWIGLSGAGLEAALLEENQARCSPPLDDGEVRKIATRVARYAPGESRDIVEIDVGGITPSIEVLNQVALFEGRIKFAKLWRTGPMIQAEFADGRIGASQPICGRSRSRRTFFSTLLVFSCARLEISPSGAFGRPSRE
jgi:hypothetical protein